MTFIQRCLNVDATSWRCIDVEVMFYKRNVPSWGLCFTKVWIVYFLCFLLTRRWIRKLLTRAEHLCVAGTAWKCMGRVRGLSTHIIRFKLLPGQDALLLTVTTMYLYFFCDSSLFVRSLFEDLLLCIVIMCFKLQYPDPMPLARACGIHWTLCIIYFVTGDEIVEHVLWLEQKCHKLGPDKPSAWLPGTNQNLSW